MTQTRTFLLLAWLMVATLLWMEWGKEQQAPVAPATTTTVPAATLPPGGVPAATPTGAPAAQAVATAPTSAPLVRLRNDVLDLQLDGIHVVRAELLSYRQTREAGSPPVVLLNPDPAHAFTASSAWLASNGRAIPLQPEGTVREHVLADGANQVEAVFSGRLADGVTLRRTYRLARGSYALRVHDEVLNAGTASWTGDVERRLERVPPIVKSGMTNPEAFSLNGAAWWSPEEKYEKRKYPDFVDDGPLNQQVTGGWVGLSQHYFLVAWIPQKDQPALYSLGTRGNLHSISARGPRITLAPGQRYTSDATLWVGPKLAEQLKAVAPGLDLAMDYGIFTVLSKPIHWLLTQLHKLTHNWGWRSCCW